MDLSLVIPRLESFEGRVPDMYRCTGGKVTIGIGHAIETPADALTLTWSISGRPATGAEIQADYAQIAAAQCHRQGIGEVRNQQTAALFLQAAG